jgi:aspartyl-tRNA(Asn)/glutamyl-tRNA(Gln) amidotransferase subunit B
MAKYILQGKTGDWELVIGLEIHAQINTKSKLFSRSSADFGAEPNSHVSMIDAAMPGMLPVLNEEAVRLAVKTGLALNGQINLYSVFDRKNYFYADLPQGYQISQFSDPIVTGGEVVIDLAEGESKIVNLERIHMEQDAGKSMHDQSPTESFIDLNRSGVPLMELVTKPEMTSPDEAGAFVKKLRTILRYVETCDGDMDKGSMRCDANVSVRKVGDKELGTRCEIKNLNSVRYIQQAIEFEAKRQIALIEEGGVVDQETRLFNVASGETKTMRTKEDAHDYRYFPDPDLLPLELLQEYVDEIKNSLPELPEQKKQKYIKDFGLSNYDANVIIADLDTAKFFEELVIKANPKLAASWLTGELFGRLNKAGKTILESPVTSANLAELIGLIENNTISGKIAKDVLDKMFASGKSASDIVKSEGLEQISDDSAIEKIIDEVLKNNPEKLAEYRSGKDKLFGFFVGQVMKETGGKANPQAVNTLLKKKLI